MISKKIEQALNNQVSNEEQASRIYMSMASWCEVNGFHGAARLLYTHSDEERIHQTKLIKFINDTGGYAVLKALNMPESDYKSLLDIFERILKHEQHVTQEINQLYEQAFSEKDFTTGQFLQWYIMEQIEEESMFKTILDKFRLAGNEKGGLFMLDKELEQLASGSVNNKE